MNRRNFFKISSFAIGAAALSNIAGGALSKVLASGKSYVSSNDFSLELVTGSGNEGKAIKLAEEFIKSLDSGSGIIKFSEYSLDRAESADIVLVQKGRVINYKNGSGDIQKGICEIANELKLPRVITNPVRLKFSSSGSGDAADNFLIFHKGSLAEKVSASTSNRNISVAGSKGEVLINISSKKARVVQSSCTHKNCINSGSISLSGENIVCIPNEVHIIAE
jgi:hypothetical protein